MLPSFDWVDGDSGAAIFFATDDFTFSESVYFVDVTVTTVGFGDNSKSPLCVFPSCSVPFGCHFTLLSSISCYFRYPPLV